MRGLPLAQPRDAEDARRAARSSSRWAPDVLVVVAYGLILPPAVLALPRLGCVNIHGSLLPRWRGAAPIQRAILAGDAETGVTIMQLDAGLDTGPMLLERRRPIGIARHRRRPARRAVRARRRGAARGASTVSPPARSGRAPQPAAGRELRAQDRKVRGAARLDARAPSQLDRQVRAFNPWPMAETRFAGETAARAARARRRAGAARDAAPGTLLGIADDGLRVACGEGVLAVRELQRAGKRPVSARDFANAVRLDGLRFGT